DAGQVARTAHAEQRRAPDDVDPGLRTQRRVERLELLAAREHVERLELRLIGHGIELEQQVAGSLPRRRDLPLHDALQPGPRVLEPVLAAAQEAPIVDLLDEILEPTACRV